MSSSAEEHIARIKAILNDKNMISRLPDGGAKLRERLNILTSSAISSSSEDAAATTSTSNNKNNNTETAGGAFGNPKKNTDSDDMMISKTTNINTKQNNNNNDNNDADAEAAVTGNKSSSLSSASTNNKKNNSTNNTSILQKAMLKSFGDNRLGHLETIRLCRGITSDEIVSKQQQGNSSLSSSSSHFGPSRAIGLVDTKPLQIMDTEATNDALHEMLEEERREELKKIRQRMELFLEK